jgi:hypothetical protein
MDPQVIVCDCVAIAVLYFLFGPKFRKFALHMYIKQFSITTTTMLCDWFSHLMSEQYSSSKSKT